MRTPRPALALVATLVAATALVGCGGGETEVVVAVDRAERTGDGIVLSVECADDARVERRADPDGSGLEELTVRASPQVGRCDTEVRVTPFAGTRFVDGATGQVVDVGTDGAAAS